MSATFVAGEASSRRHAWVTFVERDTLWLLETTWKKGALLLDAQEAESYRPSYGVDTELRTYRYEAFLWSDQ